MAVQALFLRGLPRRVGKRVNIPSVLLVVPVVLGVAVLQPIQLPAPEGKLLRIAVAVVSFQNGIFLKRFAYVFRQLLGAHLKHFHGLDKLRRQEEALF